MKFKSSFLPYSQTGSFSKIVIDYVAGVKDLQPFFSHSPDFNGIDKAIKERMSFKTNRELLVYELRKQYGKVPLNPAVEANINSLEKDNTYTVCTAHQPNLFTGHLYFIYKIIHVIRLCNELKEKKPGKNFVPVFYVGSEDADLEELGHVEIQGKRYTWETNQTGAVGRMIVDEKLITIIDEIELQVNVLPHGTEIMHKIREAYQPGLTIADACFKLVDDLFGRFGLVVLLPDNANLKRSFLPVIQKELDENFSFKAVTDTIKQFPAEYKVQASGRELNLFYLETDKRERLERKELGYSVANTNKSFTRQELEEVMQDHPARFSPNVILRPVYQEWILPNVAFVGGGGELAYWLELRKVFSSAGVPMPVLILRNSFLVISKTIQDKMQKAGLNAADVFLPEEALVKKLVEKLSTAQLSLTKEKSLLKDLYEQIEKASGQIDSTLAKHTSGLYKRSLSKIEGLEKKMLRAEKRKYDDTIRQINKIKSVLFPNNSLQERVDNLIPVYAMWGSEIVDSLLQNSGSFDQQFCVLLETE